MNDTAEPLSERVITPMAKSMVRQIADYRFSARHPSQAEAIRDLIREGLKAVEARTMTAHEFRAIVDDTKRKMDDLSQV